MAITNVKHNFSQYALDDFDETKNYQRILFKPGFAVQARELTQLQTALQAQIDKLGQHAFTDGQRILNGHPTLNINYDYIKVESVSNIKDFIGSTVTGSTNTTNQVEALVLNAVVATDSDPDTLFVAYTSSGGTARDVSKFVAGETLTGTGGNTLGNTTKTATIGGADGSSISAPLGLGSEISITEGVYFISGNFVHVPAQTMILEKYSNTPTYIVGMQIAEAVISASTAGHSNLQDNASGSSNASAPGADRYTINTTLVKEADITLDTRTVDDYIHMMTIENGIKFVSTLREAGSELDKRFEDRTQEESGDYVVNPFVLDVREDKDDGSNYGHSSTGDQDKIYVGISEGTAYVGGRRIRLTEDSQADPVRLDKPRSGDSEVIPETTQSVGYGNFVELTQASVEGAPDISTLRTLKLLHSDGTQLGTARARDLRFDSAKNVFRLFLFDIKITAQTFGNVLKVKQRNVGDSNDIFNGTLATAGKLFDSASNSLVYKLPADAIETLKIGSPADASVDAEFRMSVQSTVNVSGGAVSNVALGAPLASKDDVIVYSGDVDDDSHHAIELGDSQFNGVAITDTQISLQNLPAAFNGQQITIIFTARKTNLANKTKTFKANVTKTFTISGGSIAAEYTLSQHDIITLHHVKKQTSNEDITDRFILDGGQKDNFYQTGKLITKQGALIPNGTYVATFDHFEHTGSGDYFSVDSYAHETTGIDVYPLIPSYKGISLRDAIDFRPTKAIDVDDFTSAGSLRFATGVSPSESAIDLAITHYKGRIDKLFLTKAGKFEVVKGVASTNPIPPENIENAVHLYTFVLNPYVFGLQDVIIIPVDNRRYTMRDIAKLDKRIKNLEYYTSLSLLEKSASGAEIADVDGNIRFKNGFIVDGFFGHNVGDPSNPEYSIAIDTKTGTARPRFDERSVNLIRKSSDSDNSSSTNIARATADLGANPIKCTTAIKGGVVTLPYSEVTELNQPYASYAEFVNPYNVIIWDGTVNLSPESDEWKEVDQRPDVIINDNSRYDQFVALAEEEGILGYKWNEWETNWTGEEVTSQNVVEELNIYVKDDNAANQRVERLTGVANDNNNWRADVRSTTQAIKSTSNQTRSGINTSIDSSVQSQVVGDYIVETSYIPFMRSRKVYFDAQLMKPNTKVYAFFDGSNITSYCKQHKSGTNHADSDFVEFHDVVNGDASLNYRYETSHPDANSGELISDSTGRVIGSFIIPNNSAFKFKTGTRIFKLTDDIQNRDAESTTKAQQAYYAQGLLESRQRTILSTRIPKLVHREVNGSRTIVSNRSETTHELIRYFDPIAESFVVKTAGGIFTTGCEVFLNKIDPNIPITVSIREVENGYPTQIIVPGADRIIYPQTIVDQFNAIPANSDVTTTTFEVADASHSTTIDWDHPVHLQEGKEYALVLISNSDKYKAFVAETSKFDLSNTDFRITKQPFDGVFFTSANSSTWSAEQNKDLKFKLKRASFTTSNAEINLVNDKLPLVTLPSNPFTFLSNPDSNTSLIRVKHPNHGMYGIGSSNTGIHSVSISGVSGSVNGIAASAINGNHTIVYNTATLDTYDILVGAADNQQQASIIGLSGGGTSIKASENMSYEVFKLSTATTEFKNSKIQYQMKGRTAKPQDSSGITLPDAYTLEPAGGSDFRKILANKNQETEFPMLIASEQNQTFKNIDETFLLKCIFSTDKENLSPVLNLNRTSLITVSNRINDATTNSSAYGTYYVNDTKNNNTSNESNYITKAVELDNPAEELDIYISANKPSAANIDVYYKVGNDDTAIDEDDWTILPPDSIIPTNNNGVYSEIHYSKDFGASTFNRFIIKVVLRSQNSAAVPTIKDFRAIAST